ncbi:cyclic nucleotide-binding domain-containing protein [Modestobacter marinus]|uniref:cyclic nucleotide-binding domain-containing protein n=1 Tax=Modestobacter marinus TaxID=477641 RepID=UPI001C941ADA
MEPGECLHQAGSQPDLVFFVTSGRFILRNSTGDRVADKTGGQLIGETAALDGGARTVTVEAEGVASVLALPAESFRRRLQEDARAAYEVAVFTARILRDVSRA